MATLMKSSLKISTIRSEEKRFLRRLHKLQEDSGPVEDWNFQQACCWLGLDTRHTWGEKLQVFLEEFEQRLFACADSLGEKGEKKVRRFRKIHQQVWLKFEKHLTLLLKRRVKETDHE